MWCQQLYQYTRQMLHAWRASLIVVIALSVTTCGTMATHSTSTATPTTVHGPYVYLASGDLYALQADTGTILWRLPRLANTSVFQPPAIAGDVLYTAAATPNTSFVYAYRLGDRSLLWRHALDHPVVAPVVAIAGTIYVGLGGTSKADPSYGATCALRASDGAQLWCYTVGAPVDWMARLAAAPGVVSVTHAQFSYPDQTTPATSLTATFSPSASPSAPESSPTVAPYVYTCPGISPPAAGTPIIPNADPTGAYARVSFTSPLDTYAGALAVAVNLGLRLADPCRDAAAAHGTPPPWQSPGQSPAFASTHALVVATTWEFTSNQWQSQLAQVPGVSGVQTPYAPAC